MLPQESVKVSNPLWAEVLHDPTDVQQVLSCHMTTLNLAGDTVQVHVTQIKVKKCYESLSLIFSIHTGHHSDHVEREKHMRWTLTWIE